MHVIYRLADLLCDFQFPAKLATASEGTRGNEVAFPESATMGGTGEGGVNGASIASAVVIALLLVAAGVTVTVVVAVILYKKRYRDQMKGMCFKDGERNKLTCSCFREGIFGNVECWCFKGVDREENPPPPVNIGRQ